MTGTEDDRYVVYGPRYNETLPKTTLGRELYNGFINNDTTEHPAMIDAFSGKKLLYSELLQKTVNLAEALRIRGYGTDKTAVAERFTNLRDKQTHIERIIVINSSRHLEGTETLEDFVNDALKGKNVNPMVFQPVDRDPATSVSFVLCSSGTTGLPKGVKLSHTNIFVHILHSRETKFAYDDKVVIGVLPFFHAYGLITSIEGLCNKKLIVAISRFDEDIFLKSIQDYKIQTLFIVPPMAIILAKSPKLKKYDLSSVQQVTCGAAPLSKTIEEKVKERLNLKSMRQAYGLTESTMAVMMMQAANVHRAGSCGQVLSYLACKIRNTETGKSLGPNNVGEICLKGPMIMLGYYSDEKATKEAFTSDGWLKSGDLGYYDNEEYFYVVGRLKELIKYKGFQVAPAELEAILLNHPKILDAAVIGIPDEICGECPLAFVVKRDNVSLSKKDVETYIAGLLSPHKRLSGGVVFVEEIPKNPSGKILRRELRQMIIKYIAKSQSKL